MNLLECYLHAVKRYLPPGPKEDIIAELRDEIRSRIDEAETAQGRPLREKEQAELLRRYGDPVAVAARYRDQPRTVSFGRVFIGPELFPLYIALLLFNAVITGGWAVYASVHHTLRIPMFLVSIGIQFVCVTFAVGLVDLIRRKSSGSWWFPPAALTPWIPIARWRSASGLVVWSVFTLWWMLLPRFPWLFFGLASGIEFTSGWNAAHTPVLLLLLLGIVQRAVNFLKPGWTWLPPITRLLANGGGLVVTCLLLKSYPYVSVTGPALQSAHAARMSGIFNALILWGFLASWIWIFFLINSATNAWICVQHLRRVLRPQGWAVLLVVLLPTGRASAQTAPASPSISALPGNDEIRQVLADRIDKDHESVGMVVGIVAPEGRRIVSYGRLDRGDTRAPDGSTIFEIGSVTKVFTALLLVDMARRHEVALDDPVGRYLPNGVRVPERFGRQITLRDLATQTSGLPFWPAGIPQGDSGAMAMSRYSTDDLYKFLSSYELEDSIGTRWAYSNLGFGLLGHALCREAKMDLEALLRDRVTGPLGMKSTVIDPAGDMRGRLATGHDADLQPAPPWNVPALPGCGSLRSSADDLLTFLETCMGSKMSPLSLSAASMLETRRPGPQNMQQTLGWWILPFGPGDDWIVTHPGATLGFSSAIAYDPRAHVGVVVLSNSAGGDVGSIAWHILRPNGWPWTVKAKERQEVPVDPKLLDRYAGQYQAAPGFTVQVEHDSTGLVFKAPSTPPQGLRLHAESDSVFFVAEVDLQLTFQTDDEGHPLAVVIRFGGTDTRAPRVEASPAGAH